jgi:hypothetical protein
MNLYQINHTIQNLMTPDDDGVIQDDAFEQLHLLSLAADEKLESIGCLLKDWQAEADAIKAEADRLTERRRIIEARADRLKRYAAEQMTAMGKRKIETPRCVLALRPSKAVEVLDEAKIPDAYFAIKRTVQKAEIAKALKAGAEVPGAQLVERENLQIK